ncbi:MAG: sialate O-acetylesterase [Terriglobia bacterium]
MEFPVHAASNGPAAAAEATACQQIRLFTMEHKVSDYPLESASAEPWALCNPSSVADFSAVAYYFGNQLHHKLGVPIGLIETNWGGTPADAWTSLETLSADSSLMPVFSSWAQMMKDHASTLIALKKEREEWEQAAAKAKAEGRNPPDRQWHENLEDSWMPAGLFNAMIAPLTRYPIRGVIWYQGESNTGRDRAPLYARLFQPMIRDWRRAWGEGDFPFLFVQLANFKADDEGWPEVREAQRESLALSNTGMAVTIDIGDPSDIHPKNKLKVGRRLALAARAIAYGEKIEFSGPLFRRATPESNSVRVWFDHAHGLRVSGTGTASAEVKGFELAGADRKFVPARAQLDGNTVLVSTPTLSTPAAAAPLYVRYAWSSNPDGNLTNADGLPASPFQTHAN